MKFKEDYLNLTIINQKEKDVVDYNLLKLFNSDEYKKSCPPIAVIYPRTASEDSEKQDSEENIQID